VCIILEEAWDQVNQMISLLATNKQEGVCVNYTVALPFYIKMCLNEKKKKL
jgi:hypothetical protein